MEWGAQGWEQRLCPRKFGGCPLSFLDSKGPRKLPPWRPTGPQAPGAAGVLADLVVCFGLLIKHVLSLVAGASWSAEGRVHTPLLFIPPPQVCRLPESQPGALEREGEDLQKLESKSHHRREGKHSAEREREKTLAPLGVIPRERGRGKEKKYKRSFFIFYFDLSPFYFIFFLLHVFRHLLHHLTLWSLHL